MGEVVFNVCDSEDVGAKQAGRIGAAGTSQDHEFAVLQIHVGQGEDLDVGEVRRSVSAHADDIHSIGQSKLR